MFNRRGFLKGLLSVAGAAGITISGTTYSLAYPSAHDRRLEAVRLANELFRANAQGKPEHEIEARFGNMIEYMNKSFPNPVGMTDLSAVRPAFRDTKRWSSGFCINKKKTINTPDSEIAIGLVRYSFHTENITHIDMENVRGWDNFINKYADLICQA